MGKNGRKVKDALTKLIGGARIRKEANDAVLEKNYRILDSKIKDDLCEYRYEITGGVGLGDPHNVKGHNIIQDEMREAFAKLRPHLAVIDDTFKNKGIEVDDIDKFHGHEITGLYVVTGFKLKGDDDALVVILFGNKYLTSGARMELECPPIPLDNLSSYHHHNELKAAIEDCRYEVALYKEGYYVPVKVEQEEDEELEQGKMTFTKEPVSEIPDFENE
jgi:hypothetical protein